MLPALLHDTGQFLHIILVAQITFATSQNYAVTCLLERSQGIVQSEVDVKGNRLVNHSWH